jgi:hypothetical protein
MRKLVAVHRSLVVYVPRTERSCLAETVRLRAFLRLMSGRVQCFEEKVKAFIIAGVGCLIHRIRIDNNHFAGVGSLDLLTDCGPLSCPSVLPCGRL